MGMQYDDPQCIKIQIWGVGMPDLPSHHIRQPTVRPTDHTKGPPIQPPPMAPELHEESKLGRRIVYAVLILLLAGMIYSLVASGMFSAE
ncbi:hypothetical protein GKN94_02605 [Candidatus Lucifugimonas marina]|jgi:hypothetical protein|nr:hypothetical protein GKN94_02605 [SAR202 cluster bacterium JH545]